MGNMLGVEILEQLVAWQILATLNDPRQAPIGELDMVLFAALATKMKSHTGPSDSHVMIAQGRQAERAIVARIPLIAYTHKCGSEQLHDRGEDLLARETG